MKSIKLKDLMAQYGEYTIPDELIKELQPPKATTVWDLPNGDTYYYVDVEGDVILSAWYEGCKDERDMGNAFLTQKDAEGEVERRKVETLLLRHGGRRWFDGHNYNYHIGLDDDDEEHLKAYLLVTPTQGTIYFDTKEKVEKAISIIGEERLKILFEVR